MAVLVYVTAVWALVSSGHCDCDQHRGSQYPFLQLDPQGVAVSPDGSSVYVTNQVDNTVSAATATNTVTANIPVGKAFAGVAVSPDGSTVCVTNFDSTVSVATASNNW